MSARSTHRYGPEPDHVGDLHLPEGRETGPLPVAVVVHGGFWRERYKRDLMDALCADLAARGWAAWNIEYRRVGRPWWRIDQPRSGWPHLFADAAAATDHLVALRRSGAPLDLERVATVGHSAGGHLALWLAARHRLPDHAPGSGPHVRPAAAVGQAAVADLRLADELGLGAGAARDLLGAAPEAEPERWAAADPSRLLPTGVPTLLVESSGDDTVPLAVGEAFQRAAQRAGDSCERVVVAGGHYVHLDPTHPAWAAAAGWLGELLARPDA